MKKNLRLACLFILVFLFFTAGFVYPSSANEDSYNYSFNETNFTGKWDMNFSSPTSQYKIWGYPGKEYNFITTYNRSRFSNNATMVFYWDCKDNKSDYTHVPINNLSHPQPHIKNENISNCTHTWDTPKTYYLSVAVFRDGDSVNVSYWVPVEIRNNTPIAVQNFSMLDEKEGFDSNNIAHTYKISNFSELILGREEEFNCSNSTYNLDNSSKNCCHCGYKDNDYSFSICLNATCRKSENISALPETDTRPPTRADIQSLSETDTRTIMETTTVIKWDNTSSDNSIFGNISYSNETEDGAVISDNNVFIKSDNINTSYIQWNENFTHEWDDTGIKTVNATSFHWDPLDGTEMYSEHKNTNILIIRDPKNFFSSSNSYLSPIIGGFSNIQNKGLLLSIFGLVIFYFTYTRNNVPIKIALFGMKPFYLRSVNSFIGTLTFITGMYLYFVFGRCPWDIPIVSSLDWLSNMYFGILYYEYTKPFLGISSLLGIPYLSILLGFVDVLTLSLIIHLIAIPLYKGGLKFEKLSRIKSSSTSAQPRQGSYSIEEIKRSDN